MPQFPNLQPQPQLHASRNPYAHFEAMDPFVQRRLFCSPRLDGSIRVAEVLGQGQFTVVHKAFDTATNRHVAVKVVPKAAILASPVLMRSVEREITTLSVLRHDNICQLFGIRQDEQNFYLLLELGAGGDLLSYVTDRRKLSESCARKIFRQVVAAIAYSHEQSVIHRDIKLENILLDKSKKRVILADWGFSMHYQKDGTKLISESCGSLHYGAPEVYSGTPYRGPDIDVWTLGVLLYVLTTSSLPFDSPSDSVTELSALIRRGVFKMPNFLSDSLKHLISRMLKVNPAHRATLMEIANHPWLHAGTSAIPVLTFVPLCTPAPLQHTLVVSHTSSASSSSKQLSPPIGQMDLSASMGSFIQPQLTPSKRTPRKRPTNSTPSPYATNKKASTLSLKEAPTPPSTPMASPKAKKFPRLEQLLAMLPKRLQSLSSRSRDSRQLAKDALRSPRCSMSMLLDRPEPKPRGERCYYSDTTASDNIATNAIVVDCRKKANDSAHSPMQMASPDTSAPDSPCAPMCIV